MQFRGNWMLSRIDRDCSQTNNLRKQIKVTLIYRPKHHFLEGSEINVCIALIHADCTIILINFPLLDM